MLHRRQRHWAIAALVAAATVGLGVPLTIALHHPTPVADRVVSVIPATGQAAVSAASCVAPAVTSIPGPHAPILFVGASYTAGLGATSRAFGYAPLTAKALDRPYRTNAVPGSGYLATAHRPGGDFFSRLQAIPTSPAPGLVVFQGGRNDAGFPTGALRAATVQTIATAQHRFQGARIVMLGPVPGALPVGRSVLAVARVLDSVATTCHVQFVDPIAEHWLTSATLAGFTGHVPGHPNNAGYAYIATHLVHDIQTGLSTGTAQPEVAGSPGASAVSVTSSAGGTS